MRTRSLQSCGEESPIAFHIVVNLVDRRVIAPSVDSRCTVARVIHRLGPAAKLLAFGFADTHGHIVVASDRATAGRTAHDVETSLRARLCLPVPFAAASIVPVRDQSHLYNTVRYVLRQRPHHGLDDDPFCDASNLSDLLGLRVLGDESLLRALLPRLRIPELWELVDWANGTPPQVDAACVARYLVEAAAASVGFASVVLNESCNDARCGAVHVATGLLTTLHLSRILGIDARSVRRLKRRAPDERIVRAIRKQIRARAWHAQRTAIEAPDDAESILKT